MTVETIPIPHERVEREEQFTVRVSDLYAWPDQELIADFWYNQLRERWVWVLEHARMGRLIPKSTVTLEYRYEGDMKNYMRCRFIDPNGNADHVTTDNLGENVVLAVYPGPLGGDFHPDADISDEEAEQILGRRQWRPVR